MHKRVVGERTNDPISGIGRHFPVGCAEGNGVGEGEFGKEIDEGGGGGNKENFFIFFIFVFDFLVVFLFSAFLCSCSISSGRILRGLQWWSCLSPFGNFTPF